MIQNIFFSIQNNFIVQQSELGVLIFFNHVWKYQCHYKLFIVFIKGCPRGETCEVGTKIKTFLFFCYFLNLGECEMIQNFLKLGECDTIQILYSVVANVILFRCVTRESYMSKTVQSLRNSNSAVITQQRRIRVVFNNCTLKHFCEYWNSK